MISGKRVLTTGEVAKICSVAPRTVSKWFDSGQLNGYKIPGSKDRRIPVSELVRFMKEYNIPPANFFAGTLRVLIADSNKKGLEKLTEGLKAKADYQIEAAQSNFQIGSAVQKFNPHVILINLLAGDIDSDNICKNIRASEELQTIKIVGIAKKPSDAEIKELMKKGFDGIVTDRNNIDEVIRKIEEATAIVY
jgi:excisionase family DNA binding protein